MPETQLILNVEYSLPEDKAGGAVVLVNDCVCSTTKNRARFVGLTPGKYDVHVIPRGIRHASRTIQVQVPNGKTTTVTVKLPHYVFVYFSIYYRTSDDAFKRASETWFRSLSAPLYHSDIDRFIAREVSTEADFVAAWAEVQTELTKPVAEPARLAALEGRMWTHASKSGTGDGLEFLGEDNTLTQAEIAALTKLVWHPSGLLYLHGCNTGLKKNRTWCPAEEMHKAQGIGTIGQTGYAYFSTDPDEYVESSPQSQDLYLWAYRRGKNGLLGGGGAMPQASFGPVAAAMLNKLGVLPPFLWKECRKCAS